MATMKEVASLVGVSLATVSRVLNDKGYVHEDTRKLVETAIQQLAYSPNEVARSLFKKEIRIIGLLLLKLFFAKRLNVVWRSQMNYKSSDMMIFHKEVYFFRHCLLLDSQLMKWETSSFLNCFNNIKINSK